MLRFTSKDTIQETCDFDIILLQIYWSTHVPKITETELGLIKLLQK